ncbi:MAG: O-antigen ligase family protein [Pseudomonadota bacterium]
MSAWTRYLPAALIFAVVALLPFSRLSALPMALMMVGGIMLTVRHGRRLWEEPALGLFTVLFLAYFLPVLVSCLDAVAPERSWPSAVAYLRFLPVGIFVIHHLGDPDQRRALWLMTAVLVMVWCVDALIQFALGRNVLGMPLAEDRLNGIFGETNIKLGHVLAVLSPVPLEYCRRFGPRWAFPVCLGALLAVIALVSTRAAWVMFALVLLAYVYVYAQGRPRRWIKAALIVATVAGGSLFVGYQMSPTLAERLDRSLLLLEGDRESVDRALGGRLPIWRTAGRMAADHPINGVGARGFRYAYPEYADAADHWVNPDKGTGAAHAHQLLLEVLTETGVIGLVGLLFALVLSFRFWQHLTPARKHTAYPFALALGVMLFPVNTHLAFYSTFWSLLCWWLVMVFLGFARSPSPSAASGAASE